MFAMFFTVIQSIAYFFKIIIISIMPHKYLMAYNVFWKTVWHNCYGSGNVNVPLPSLLGYTYLWQ